MDKVAFVCCNKPTQFKSADVKMALILGVHSCLLSIPLYPITVLYIIMTKELKMIRDQMSYGKNGVSAQFQWRLFSITHFLWIYELIDIILVAKPLRQWKPVYYM